MRQIYANNASTTLSAALTDTATTMTVVSAAGFPVPGQNQFFLVTVTNGETLEIIMVTSVSGNTFTIGGNLNAGQSVPGRGQESTTAESFAAGATVDVRLTAGTLASFSTSLALIGSSDQIGSSLTSFEDGYISGTPDNYSNPVSVIDNGAGNGGWAPIFHTRVIYDTVQSSTTTSLTGNLNSGGYSAVLPSYKNGAFIIQFFSGPWAGLIRQVTAYTNSTVTWSTPMPSAPGSNSSFGIYWATSDMLNTIWKTTDNLGAQVQAGVFVTGTDTGTANNYVVVFSPALADPPSPGMIAFFKVANNNTAASTLTATGVSHPLVGGGKLALQGGELVANGWTAVQWDGVLNSWVLLWCTGASIQVLSAVNTNQGVNLGQLQNTSQQYTFVVGTDIGSVNNCHVIYSPAITSPTAQASLFFLVKNTNTGPTYFNATGVAYDLLGQALQPLQGGELVAGGRAEVVWNVAAGAWILIGCTGGAQQSMPGTQSNQVVIYSQLQTSEAPGILKDYAGPTIPTGYLLCDGTAYSRTTYANLFNAIGTYWGAGDGSTTFNVPNLMGRTTIGAGTGAGLTARTLGQQNIGEEGHVLSGGELASHTHGLSLTDNGHVHTVYDPSHTHTINEYTGAGSQVNTVNVPGQGSIVPTTGAINPSTTGVGVELAYTGITGSIQVAGSSSAHNTMQPSAVVMKIIKY